MLRSKKQKAIRSLEHIPAEILAEILKWLPLISLLQFRTVSKTWKRLIDSPCFIAFYGVRHPLPRRLILRIDDLYAINEHKFYCYVDDEDHQDRFYQDSISSPDILADYQGCPCGVGSSHGLVCFKIPTNYKRHYFHSEMVVLWNLSIRKYVRIPVPGSRNRDDVIGFGVCPVTFDPTILSIKRKSIKRKWKIEDMPRISLFWNVLSKRKSNKPKWKTEDRPGISLLWNVRVFTLSTGTWSTLSTNMPRESIRLKGSQVVIHRFIYWAAFDQLESEDGRSQSLIVSFDLIAKEFKEINLTGNLTNPLCSIHSISKLRESLVLLEYHREFEERLPICCLWMMEEQGVDRSFTKLYNINVPHATLKTLLGFTKFGDLLLVTQEQEEGDYAHLKIYYPDTEEIYDLEDGNDYSFFMWSYTETLLLLDHANGFKYSIRN
uniref:uncharacterized protein LOC122601040 n=1 Tax=Erigeron canadensis TaxID=72917 RepID=UPI001CB8FA30|nr:uncharacterized protein LOC122601040 [Erigeron canadensis]